MLWAKTKTKSIYKYKAGKKYRNNLKQDRTWKTICSSGKIMDFRPKLEFPTLFTRCVAWNK